MRTKTLILIPLLFVCGMLATVLIQVAGLIQISKPLSLSTRADTMTAESGAAGTVLASKRPTVETSNQSTLANVADAKSDEKMVAALTTQVDELRKQVQAATVQRDVMQGKIKELSELLDSATDTNAFLPNGQGAGSQTGEAGTNANEFNAGDSNQFNRRRGFGQPDGSEQYDSLVAAGIDPSVASEIKQRSDQWSLQRLELIDQASREGWRQSDQFGERLEALQEERPDIRSELGDSDYDQYLYVSGESNRVQIANIIDGSAAQLAGMETGDLLRTYANERVFSSRELQRATREGSRGELVPITVERGGQLIGLDLPRGPMGVTLNGLRVEPDGF